MRIATTYDNGNIFQHFGRTEFFKVYEVEDGKVVSSEVISSNGAGHGALATVLAENGVNALICGGLGGGALNALTEAGIEVCAGASGDTDAAVEAYLKGELVDTGVNCDHHDHEHGEGHSCGGNCGGDDGMHACGGGCSGCGGGGQTVEILYEGPNAGKTVMVHYKGTFNDGTQFDSSYDRGQPMEFICGVGMMIPGFDKAVVNMTVGQVEYIHLTADEAYGQANPNMIVTFDLASLPGAENLSVGEKAYLSDASGQPFPVVVTAKDEETITLDANHEMAGKELNFKIELLNVK